MNRGRIGIWMIVLLLASAVAGAQADLDERSLRLLGEPNGSPRSGAALERATEEVTSLMRCPVCQGLSVFDSGTPSALAMRAKAEVLLAAGYDEEQVLTYFETSYGEFIRLAPKPRGFNLFVWVVPAVFLLLGGWLILQRVRSKTAQEGAVEADAELEAYRERVRREVSE